MPKPPTIGVSEFKAKCLRLIEDLDRNGGRIVITKRGREVAQLVAKARPRRRKSSFGCLKGKFKVVGDIVHFDTTDLWEVLK
jgi:antitoxin (DNA-binding transcriptional repressor) of toxin-antitoxin stability system